MSKIPKKALLKTISLYQKLLSPARGALRYLSPNQCLYTPSCSEYSMLAIKKYGIFRGTGKTVWRLLRCNPWGKGGKDIP